jgi:Family of unknown function (DUF6152)
MKHLRAILAAGVLITGGGLAFAHNSLSAEYDIYNPAIIEGIVTTIDWMTPRSFLTIEGKGANGKLAEFRIDLGSPHLLERKGWTRHTVKEGETVTVIGWYARRDPSRIKAVKLKLHGKEFGAGLTFSEATQPN